jgi:mycoredoxin
MTIRVLGTTWCGDTVRARAYFDTHHVPYEWIDVELDSAANEEATAAGGGTRRVPVIFFDDGTVLIEPTDEQLAHQLTHEA